MKKWLKKKLEDLLDLDMMNKYYTKLINDSRIKVNNIEYRCAELESQLRKYQQVSADVNLKEDNLVILTGKLNGRNYVEIYSFKNHDFIEIANHLKELKKHHRIVSLDAPINFRDMV
jgi:hypothetical protein